MIRWPPLWYAAVAGFAVAGCGGATLKGQAGAVAELIDLARESGAIRCAPVELAMAESHHAFANEDLARGRYYRARDGLRIAETNAREAVRRSPRAKCALAEAPSDRDGDGIPDDQDLCPDDPEDLDGFEDEDGCPDPDNDGDGIPDASDRCPDQPEDFDGFEDEDGCPDPDNDQDGFPDEDDHCPDEPGPDTEDGCPVKDPCVDPGPGTPECPKTYDLVVVTEEKIELKQTVFFDFNKSTIKPVSYPLLDQVAEALVDNPTITVRIEGHTDSRGRRPYNLRLSQSRADAVKKYLVRRGIEVRRMVSRGYGPDIPIADNRTDEGRAENRRVEFVITGR